MVNIEERRRSKNESVQMDKTEVGAGWMERTESRTRLYRED